MAFGSATISSDVIAGRFADLRGRGRRALIPFVTAGHPSRAESLELIRGLPSAGADLLEVGVPFSDPMADGPVIQAASQRALANGMSLDGTLALIHEAAVGIPIVLFSYLNPLLAAGADVLARAADAGVHGILVTDLPVGADPEREEWLGAGPLAFVRLVAPTTPTERMREIARHGRGFVYLIARRGVTGAREDLPPDLAETIGRLRGATTLPICAGFGIATPSQAAAVAGLADGVIVGSAVVRAADAGGAGASITLVRAMRAAMDRA